VHTVGSAGIAIARSPPLIWTWCERFCDLLWNFRSKINNSTFRGKFREYSHFHATVDILSHWKSL
jgi:hypothetical protein